MTNHGGITKATAYVTGRAGGEPGRRGRTRRRGIPALCHHVRVTTHAAPRAPLTTLTDEEVRALVETQRRAYDDLTARGLTLDLTRGKPSAEQLDLADALLTLPTTTTDPAGTDVRNYGGVAGLPAIRAIFGELLGVDPAQLVAGGNSSLTMMHDCLVQLLLHGAPESPRPWCQEEVVRFVCPVPGYDRHFTMLASYGIEMIPVPMLEDGPDIEAVRAAVADPGVKGMWLVPTYANPTGVTTTQEVAAELASIETAAPDFRIFWDNAYALHHLTEEETKSVDILSLASASGHPNRPLLFASTSKITYAGAGVAFLGASPENIAWYTGHMSFATIGPDKVNHLRHAEFFGDADGVRAHMARHRASLAPKFAAVDAALRAGLEGYEVATWSHPRGGYFVDLDVVDGTATRVVELAKAAGIVLTPAGSAFPHGHDPRDRNIRLAPSFPALAEVEAAMAGVATCVLLAAAEQELRERG